MSTVMRPSLPQPHVMLRIGPIRSEEHTSELQSRSDLVCRLLLEKKKNHSLTQLQVKRVGTRWHEKEVKRDSPEPRMTLSMAQVSGAACAMTPAKQLGWSLHASIY